MASRLQLSTRLRSIISFLATIAIACSLAEIASIYPTAGGQSNHPMLMLAG
jgi:hypothetical protein